MSSSIKVTMCSIEQMIKMNIYFIFKRETNNAELPTCKGRHCDEISIDGILTK